MCNGVKFRGRTQHEDEKSSVPSKAGHEEDPSPHLREVGKSDRTDYEYESTFARHRMLLYFAQYISIKKCVATAAITERWEHHVSLLGDMS